MNIPIWVPEAFRVIAHRGSSAYAPENTLPAFKLAREMGFGEVELDVQLAIDGMVVLCHDLELTRYGHGDVVVEEMASDELLALDMGSWFSPHLFAGTPMLSLDQLLKTHGDDFIFTSSSRGVRRSWLQRPMPWSTRIAPTSKLSLPHFHISSWSG